MSSCRHDPYNCSLVSYPWRYAVTRAITLTNGQVVPEFIRWSTPDDPMFPCLCTCGECCDWRETRAEIDGPIILPVS